MPFSRRLRSVVAAVHDSDGRVGRVPPGASLDPIGRSVVDVETGRWWGIDVAVDSPEIRTADEGEPGPGVWSARDLLSEIGDRRDLIDINAGLLTMALRAVATADIGAVGDRRGEPVRAVVAVHPRFAADDGFLPTVKTTVRRSGLDAGQLLLSVAAEGIDESWPAVQRLRSHGVKVALEAGIASLEETEELLHRLSFDLVRVSVDRVLEAGGPVASDGPDNGQDADRGAQPTPLLRHLLANGRRVWVEGVTEAATLDELRCLGCSLASGPVVDDSHV